MPRDLSKYRHHVDHFDLTNDEKDDLVQTVYNIMENRLDCALGSDAVQLASNPDDVIDLTPDEYRVSDLSQTFNHKKGANQHD